MERTWFPQRNASDASVALLKNFIFNLGFPLSRKTIEADVRGHKEFPYLSIEALVSILGSWGIKSAAFNCKVQMLNEMPVPSITFIHEQNDDVKMGNFVLFFGIKDGIVNYLHMRRGWVLEPIAEFEKKWAKAMLAILEITSEGEQDVDAKEEEYTRAWNANPDLQHIKVKDDFLTDEECDHVLSLAENIFKRSRLMDETNIEGYGRTSYSAELHIFPNDPVLLRIRKKASELIGMPESNFEHFQCVSYDPNQEYQNHYDTFDESSERGRKTIDEGGQRKYTLLAYLNDDFEGGGTHFPNVDVLVQPKKRRVVIFNNLGEDGKVLKAAYHAGLPVTVGRKYAINIWVRTKPVRD